MKARKWTEDNIATMETDGVGQGTGADYIPWLAVRDISSSGVSRRVWGHKTQREHHLLSNVEFNLFLCLEWAEDIVDIREQYPLNRQLTQACADSLQIKHPYYPGTHVPTVMTVDFVVTRVRDGQEVHEAFNAKTADEAEDDRSLQKLEIQREACELMGLEHHLVLDSSIPKQIVSNIGWIRDALPKLDEPDVWPGRLDELCARMENDFDPTGKGQTLQSYCAGFDTRFGLPTGMGLRLARILLHRRILKADMASDIVGARLDTFYRASSASIPYALGGR